ncbi:MAG: RsmE family RNA methyltransferase [Catalinimonas sp.]
MVYFYVPDLRPPLVTLPDDEAHHAVKVLRLRTHDEVALLDGRGYRYLARLVEVSPKRCRAEVLDRYFVHERDYELHVALAPTKSLDRTEWFVEKAVEIGVDQITFVQTEHSERPRLRLDRLEKRAISALKQSQRARLPVLHGLTPLADFLRRPPNGAQRMIAHLAPEDTEFPGLDGAVSREEDAYEVLIGPEGGFTPDEVEAAGAAGFRVVTLGAFRLRTETAGIVACQTVALTGS